MACLKEFEEIVLLCGNSYGSGATKLLRTFFERVTTVAYLGKHPEKVQQFIDYTPVHWYKLLTEAEKKHDAVGLSEEELAKIKADFETVKEKYQDACRKCGLPHGQGSWTKKPVPEMAEDVDKKLRLLYFNAFLKPTFLIHATYFGVMMVAGISDGKVHFFKPENEREMAADTLTKAHLLLIIMAIAVNKYFAPGSEDLIERLGSSYNDAWPVKPKEQ
ncbi:MAG: hypothetical protein IRZ15_10570 [Bryobacteraceae bacterium]|nr:hypothetical protein [Bryobacteraceae bacterium]